MIKPLCFSSMLVLSVYAQDFEAFLQHAIAKSPYLKASAIQIEQAQNQGDLLLRYENPNIELEASAFDPDTGEKESGYRVTLTQPLRLWGVSNDKRHYANALARSARAEDALNRAQFVRDISQLYLQYAYYNKLIELGKEELDLAKNIYDISYERFKEGTISRGKLLQAKIEYEMAKSRYENLQIEQDRKYYFLLKAAGINKEIPLDTGHIFTLLSTQEKNVSPDRLLLQTQSDASTALAKTNENRVEWIDLYGEYENEPEQEIARFGVSIPLAVFNTKSQERRLARLETERVTLLESTSAAQNSIEQRRLTKESARLIQLKERSEAILKTELELLGMYEEGYRIANVNLLELQDIKNKVIDTKKRLIDIQTSFQSNIIHQNYLQGNYNE